MSTEPVEKHYRRHEACEVTGLSEPTIDRAIRSGALPVIRVGRAVLIPAKSLRDFLDKSTVPSGQAKTHVLT